MRQGTSIAAYYDLKAEGKLGPMQERVYQAIAHRPNHTDRELALMAGFNQVAHYVARRNELMNRGLVEQSGRRKCQITGRQAMTWRIVTEAGREQPSLF